MFNLKPFEINSFLFEFEAEVRARFKISFSNNTLIVTKTKQHFIPKLFVAQINCKIKNMGGG
jgi:hypothetical protein